MMLNPDIGQWLDIKKNPIPQSNIFDSFIVTDGKKVDTYYTRKYNSHGELIMGYADEGSVVKYWRPRPLPPTKNQEIGS